MDTREIEKTFTVDAEGWALFNTGKLHEDIKLKFSNEKIIYTNINEKETATLKIKDIVEVCKSEYRASYGNGAFNRIGVLLLILFIIYACIATNYYVSTEYLLGGVIRDGAMIEFTEYSAPIFFNPVVSIIMFFALLVTIVIISKTTADKYVLIELKGASNNTMLFFNFKADRTEEISEIYEFINKNINGYV